MKILALYMLCSMIGGIPEVLFIAAKDFISGRFGGTSRRLPENLAPALAQVSFVPHVVPTIESNAGGLEPQHTELMGGLSGRDTQSGVETVRFKVATWKA